MPWLLVRTREFRLLQQISDCLPHYLTIDNGDRRSQGDVFGANLDAISREAALVNSALPHHCLKPLMPQMSSRRMHVEESHLVNDCGPNEVR